MNKKQICLRDHFLISMPHLQDDGFAKTIIYLCDHSEYGAMGLVINQPLALTLSEMLTHLDMKTGKYQQATSVYAGGPVQSDRGFVLHRPYLGDPWLSTYKISDEIQLTTSLDILEAISSHGSAEALIAIGYAGWGAGQLEEEISNNVWLSCPANSDIMFNMPAGERMQAAAALLGVNLNLLTAHSGRA